jgi:hypothetical protein
MESLERLVARLDLGYGARSDVWRAWRDLVMCYPVEVASFVVHDRLYWTFENDSFEGWPVAECGRRYGDECPDEGRCEFGYECAALQEKAVRAAVLPRFATHWIERAPADPADHDENGEIVEGWEIVPD